MTIRNLSTISLVSVVLIASAASAHAASRLDKYYAHETREDEGGVLAPWHEGQNGQLDERLRIAIEVYKRLSVDRHGASGDARRISSYNSHWSITSKGEIQIPVTN